MVSGNDYRVMARFKFDRGHYEDALSDCNKAMKKGVDCSDLVVLINDALSRPKEINIYKSSQYEFDNRTQSEKQLLDQIRSKDPNDLYDSLFLIPLVGKGNVDAIKLINTSANPNTDYGSKCLISVIGRGNLDSIRRLCKDIDLDNHFGKSVFDTLYDVSINLSKMRKTNFQHSINLNTEVGSKLIVGLIKKKDSEAINLVLGIMNTDNAYLEVYVDTILLLRDDRKTNSIIRRIDVDAPSGVRILNHLIERRDVESLKSWIVSIDVNDPKYTGFLYPAIKISEDSITDLILSKVDPDTVTGTDLIHFMTEECGISPIIIQDKIFKK